MSKVIIETVDGVENATAIVEFDLGKVLRDKVSEDGKVHSVPVTMSIDGMIEFYRKLAYEKAMDGDMEGYEVILEQYVILKVNEIIGVESTPLTIDSTEVLVGLRESVEVEFKGNKVENIEIGEHRMVALGKSENSTLQKEIDEIMNTNHQSVQTTAKYYDDNKDITK